jgi:hypothetical protein
LGYIQAQVVTRHITVTPLFFRHRHHPTIVLAEMHRCLQILEIVELVLSHLDPSSLIGVLHLPFPYRDLAMAARTCTAFQGPALDRLWSSTDLFKLLTRCMPSDLWAIDVVPCGWRQETKLVCTDRRFAEKCIEIHTATASARSCL